MLDQLDAALGCDIDQFGGFLQVRAVGKARDQRLRGAGDHGQHVVEVVGDAAGQLADGVELLRLLQLAFGVAGAGDVVIEQRRAADGARGVPQRPARDDEMDRRVAAARPHHDFGGVEFLAAQRAGGRHLAGGKRRNAVGVKHRAQRPQQLDRHARPVAQHPFRGRVGEHHLALGIDHEHRLGHAVKHALHDLGGMPQVLVRFHQMLGPLGDRRFQRLVGGLAGGERFLQLPARAPGRQRQRDGKQHDQHHARQIDRQQDAPVDLGIGAVEPQQPSFLGNDLFQVGADRLRHGAIFGLGHQRGNSGAVAGVLKPDQLARERNLAGHQRLGLLQRPGFARVGPDGREQVIEGRQERRAGVAVLPGEFAVAGDRKAAGGAFRAAHQRPQIRDLLQHLERAVDGSRIRSRLQVETDRGSAD